MAGTVEQPIDVARSTLGGALRNGPLSIPNYQREYSWKKERIKKLFDDLGDAMRKQQSSYFLGTVVLTPGHPPSVIDGQQRLATTAIFLAAIRDAMLAIGKEKEAKSIEDDFLFKYDRTISDSVPRLSMNTDDRSYMKGRVFDRPSVRVEQPMRFHSHRRINEAAGIAADKVAKIMANAESIRRKVEALNTWIEFIDSAAIIVMLTPPNAARAYQIFKTTNDRAQRTTQADMIKNLLFEHAGNDVDEAQAKWSTMRSTIEGVDPPRKDDPLLSYLHHVSIVFDGPIQADDIFEMMEERVVNKTAALRFLDAFASYASDYAAIVTPSHAKWGKYDKRVRECVHNIAQEIKMTFIRPLMLSIASSFPPGEAHKAFRMLVSWVVRFLISGGSRSGIVERAFGDAAHAIREKKIKTAQELANEVLRVVPNDTKFLEAFSRKTLANARQARFILRELEAQKRGGRADALLQPVPDTDELSLEHILPKNPIVKTGWSHFTADERKTYKGRLGNMILLDAEDNGAIGDKPFADKRPIIQRSQNILLTRDVIDRTDEKSNWTTANISERQAMMADLAVKRWPLTP